jgi:TPR repeat protein
LLDQEHERTRALEEQVADLRGAPMVGRSDEATSPQSGLSAPTPVPAAKQPVNTPVPGDTVAIPAVEPATMTARPAAPEAPRTAGDLETVRLMERANLLVAQGDVGAARNVLERAAESGNAAALFALAETHDPVVLAAWGTLGTQGDVAKAKELYARALKGGIVEAKRRLEVLP